MNPFLIEDFATPSTIGQCQNHLNPHGTFAICMVSLDLLGKDLARLGDEKLASIYLVPEEMGRFSSFTYSKRRYEFLGGRIAAKSALVKLLNIHSNGTGSYKLWQNMHISSDEKGRPYIMVHDDEKKAILTDISISHSGDFAVGMALKTGCCGIDIQQITSRVMKVKKRFSIESEEMLLSASIKKDSSTTEAPNTYMTMLWAAKESLRKSLGRNRVPGFMELILVGVDMILPKNGDEFFYVFNFRSNGMKKHIKVIILPLTKYVLAFNETS